MTMAKPGKRQGSSKFQFRRMTPSDLWRQRDALKALGFTVRREVSQSLDTRDPREAKQRQSQLSAEWDARWQSWRYALANGPRVLTQKQVFALG
ncbi:MAG: DUF6538 domain-containing protein, partial [Aestuariivirga sp.]